MAKDNSFDVVSKLDLQEMDNAINQTLKEIENRFDFKNSKSNVEFDGKKQITLISDDDFKLRNVIDIFESKLVKRGISLKALTYGKVLPAAGDTVKQVIDLQQGLSTEQCKEVVKFIKDSKIKVQASIQGDSVRVTGKSRDDLQQVISMLRNKDWNFDIQFDNYR